jgi:hypothetical protein
LRRLANGICDEQGRTLFGSLCVFAVAFKLTAKTQRRAKGKLENGRRHSLFLDLFALLFASRQKVEKTNTKKSQKLKRLIELKRLQLEA